MAYADRLLAAEALVLIYPVWNEGFPAILKGFFDRVLIPGVSSTIGADGAPIPNLQNLRSAGRRSASGADLREKIITFSPLSSAAERRSSSTRSNIEVGIGGNDTGNRSVGTKRSVSEENDMPKDAHNKAAEHHESAAKSHKMAAEHHAKGDHAKGREESAKAQTHSKTAREHSEMAHGKSQSQK